MCAVRYYITDGLSGIRINNVGGRIDHLQHFAFVAYLSVGRPGLLPINRKRDTLICGSAFYINRILQVVDKFKVLS